MAVEVKREQSHDELRDLNADLALAERAAKGPWKYIDGDNVIITLDKDAGYAPFIAEEFTHGYDAEFIAESREGWPHAIRRAIAAEARVAELEVENQRFRKALESVISRCSNAEAYTPEAWAHYYAYSALNGSDSDE